MSRPDVYNETFKTWNKVASLYEEKFMNLDIYNESYDVVCNSVKQNAAILDVGCGPGNITKYLLYERPDLNIYGIDISPNMVAIAKKNNLSANFGVMDMRQAGQLATKFDAIVCGFCFPYMSPDEALTFIADAHHLLSDCGLLYVSFVAGNPDKSGFQVGGNGDRVFFNYHDLDILTNAFIECGFDVATPITVDYKGNQTEVHTILIATKNKAQNL